MFTKLKRCRTGNTFRCSRITLLNDPAAKLTRMKVRVFSDSTLSVGVSNPDPSNSWTTKLEDVWNEHGCVETLNLATREVQFIWHILPGASTLDIEKHIQRYLNGQNPESFDERILSYSCLCSSTLNGQRKAIQKLVCTMPKRWQHLRPNSSQDTSVSWSPRQKMRGGTQNPTNFKENENILKCHTSHPIFPATEPLSLGQLRRGNNKLPLPGYIRKQDRLSSIPFWQAIYNVFAIEFASGMRLKIRYQHQEERKTKSKSISTPSRTLNKKNQRKMPES